MAIPTVLVGRDGRAGDDIGVNEDVQGGGIGPLDHSRDCFAFALESTDDRDLASGAGAVLGVALVPVGSLAVDIGFVGLNVPVHLLNGAEAHRQTDAMVHVPRALLRDAERPGHFVGAYPVLAVSDHPDCDKPLVEREGAILENRADLGGELLARVLFLALPKAAGRDKTNVRATARRAVNAFRPTKLDHVCEGHVRVCEVPDCFHEGAGFLCHAP